MDDIADTVELAQAETAAVEAPAAEFTSFEPQSFELTARDEYDVQTVEELVKLPPPYEIEGETVAFVPGGSDAQTFDDLFEPQPLPTASLAASTGVAFTNTVETAQADPDTTPEASAQPAVASEHLEQNAEELVSQEEDQEPTATPFRSSILAYLWGAARGMAVRRSGTKRDE